MRLGQLIGELDSRELEEVAHRVIPGAAELPNHLWPHNLESILRDTGEVEQTVNARRPPVLATLIYLLETEGHSAGTADLAEPVMALTKKWCRQVSRGELLGRDGQCRIYRRVLTAAWQSDLELDSSETALLGLLRKELGMTRVEHFLLAHHRDIQPFWRHGDPLSWTLDALRKRGILYARGEDIVLPEELVPHVRRALGVEMSRAPAARLYGNLSRADLRAALADLHLRVAGSKSEQVQRLVDNLAPASSVVSQVGIFSLRKLARHVRCRTSGSKEELVFRLTSHFDAGLDLAEAPADEPEPEPEEKALDDESFFALFGLLTGRQLETLCIRFGLRHSGPKRKKLGYLRSSRFAESTLLRKLRNPELIYMLGRCELDKGGRKAQRADRLVAHFGRSAATPPGDRH